MKRGTGPIRLTQSPGRKGRDRVAVAASGSAAAGADAGRKRYRLPQDY